MGFSYGRSEGFPSQYGENKTPVTVDVLDWIFIISFLIVFISTSVVYFRFKRIEGCYLFIRVFLFLGIGLTLLYNNYGQDWEVGSIETKTAYRVGGNEINAKIGIKIGLRSINVTLKGTPSGEITSKYENIDYNERFEWIWDQGRFGFGPYAGRLQRGFRQSQYRGLPLPILWIIDYFVPDGEGLRYGRFYRTAGWYTHLILSAAFMVWVVANILLKSLLHYRCLLICITGLLQLAATIVFSYVRNPEKLIIYFGNIAIDMNFGHNYWLNLISGVLCIVISIIMGIMNHKYPDEIFTFFGIDPIADFEDKQITWEEFTAHRKEMNMDMPSNEMEMEEADIYADMASDEVITIMQRRKSILSRKQSKRFSGLPKKEDEMYGNVDNSFVTGMEDTIRLHESGETPPERPPKRMGLGPKPM